MYGLDKVSPAKGETLQKDYGLDDETRLELA
jgi:hypothetical protein